MQCWYSVLLSSQTHFCWFSCFVGFWFFFKYKMKSKSFILSIYVCSCVNSWCTPCCLYFSHLFPTFSLSIFWVCKCCSLGFAGHTSLQNLRCAALIIHSGTLCHSFGCSRQEVETQLIIGVSTNTTYGSSSTVHGGDFKFLHV